jgi:hypothetical protein
MHVPFVTYRVIGEYIDYKHRHKYGYILDMTLIMTRRYEL